MAIAEQLGAETHFVPSRTCDLNAVENLARMCNNAAFNFKTGKAAPFHVAILDEADGMTSAAQNSLLSKLDETMRPPRTIFIFTANSTATLEDRFLSRCRVLHFDHESLEGELEEYLAKVYKREGGKHPLDFKEICKATAHNVRDSLMKLEVELLMGSDRSDLPPEKELEPIKQHPHVCKKCAKSWRHADEKCELPYRSLCPQCGGGPKTVGQVRAGKAWKTIREKIAKELQEKKKKGKQ